MSGKVDGLVAEWRTRGAKGGSSWACADELEAAIAADAQSVAAGGEVDDAMVERLLKELTGRTHIVPMKHHLKAAMTAALSTQPAPSAAVASEYLVVRPDGTQYRTDPGGADMARKREGFRVYADVTAALPAPSEQVAASVAAPDEAQAFRDWFFSQQGTEYDGMWSFARAAWMHRAAAHVAPEREG